jgi:hypothetical protein
VAHAHTAKSTAALAVVITSDLPQADGIEHTEYGLACGGNDWVAIEPQGDTGVLKGLNVVETLHFLHDVLILGDTRAWQSTANAMAIH